MLYNGYKIFIYIYKEHLFIRHFHDKTDIKKLVSLNSTYFWLDRYDIHTHILHINYAQIGQEVVY